ncbi:MAG: hypothetical protein QXT77_07960, partial [Candidatus Methanomethylicaceae archaeon]
MTCYYPISGWKAASKNPTGKRSIVFNSRDGLADMPVELPCGKCTGCRADQALMWSIRAYHESTLHDQNSFITLTYDDDHLPKDGLIDKKHLQDFFKRLRRDLPPGSVRYIACGEYGDQTRRPHYHAILFGLDFLHDKITINEDLYTSPTLEKFWGQGHVSIAPVTMASICYVCGYVMKKINDADTFNLMSRRPGIGSTWLSLYKDDLIRTGSVTIEGREYPVPKRYLDWEPEEFEQLKRQRLK